MKRKKGYDRHHIIPLSLGGEDIDKNQKHYTKKTHKEIHKTLNLSRSEYSKLNRKRNKAQNGKMLKSKDGLNIDHDMQKKYFDKLGKLPPDIIHDHHEVMNDLAKHKDQQLHRLTKGRLYEGEKDFDTAHNTYHNILLEIQRALKKALLYFFE